MTGRRGTAIWSPEALFDLDQIWDYYERVAGRNTKSVKSSPRIEDHPFAGRSRNELRSGLRSLAAISHVVFYRVTDDIPEIIRILDSRRDIEEIFAD